MKTYANWAPTQHDRKGLNLPDRQSWFVLPVILTRDSGPLEQSNFRACLAQLGGESDTLEQHSFDHWACGRFNILLLDPSRQAEGDATEARLEDYPILDENDFSNREWEAYAEGWASYGKRDFIRELVKEFGLTYNAEAVLENSEALHEFYESLIPSGEYFVGEDSGVRLNINYAVDRAQREDVAKFLRECRRDASKGKETK